MGRAASISIACDSLAPGLEGETGRAAGPRTSRHPFLVTTMRLFEATRIRVPRTVTSGT